MIFWNFWKRVFSIDRDRFGGANPGLNIFDDFGKLAYTDDLRSIWNLKITLFISDGPCRILLDFLGEVAWTFPYDKNWYFKNFA